jgi:ADP-heptose:LPS heptosyltransferase
MLLGSRTREVVENNPHVSDIFILDKDKLRRQSRAENFRDLWALGKKLREKKYDLLLDYSLRPENAFWYRFLLGIPKRAGFGYKRRAIFHNIRFPLPEGYWKQHVVDFYAGLAELAGIPVGDRFLEYYLPANEAELGKKVAPKLGPLGNDFIAVSPGGGDSWGKEADFKRWPVKNFSEFIQKLRTKVPFKGVCILGSRSEVELCDALKNSLKMPSVVLAGETTLAETAVILKRSKLFLGNDGGLVHLSRALRVPLAAFYGPVPPEVYGPYPVCAKAAVVAKKDLECRPCYYRFRFKNDCPTIACLKELSADEALRQLEENRFFENF